MKYFRMSYDEVVYKRSYINLILLNAAIPSVKPFDEENESETAHTNTRSKRNVYKTNDNGNSFFSSLM